MRHGRNLELRLSKLRRRAEEEQTWFLGLQDLGLGEVPGWVFELDLVTLDVSGNELSTFSDEIGLLVRLEVLDVRRNALTEVPAALRSLVRLEELYLDHNRIAVLPLWLGELPALRYVQLLGNPLSRPMVDAFRERWPALVMKC